MYNIQASETSAFSELSVNSYVVSSTEYYFKEYELDAGTKYYWRVKYFNDMTGHESEWSLLCWFITIYDDIEIIQNGLSATIIYEIGKDTHISTIPDGVIEIDICCSGTTSADGTINEKLCCGGNSSLL